MGLFDETGKFLRVGQGKGFFFVFAFDLTDEDELAAGDVIHDFDDRSGGCGPFVPPCFHLRRLIEFNQIDMKSQKGIVCNSHLHQGRGNWSWAGR